MTAVGSDLDAQPGGIQAREREYTVMGETFRLPAVIRHASAASAMFFIPAGPVQDMIAYSGLEVAEPLPGRAGLCVVFVKYVDTDFGPYNEVGVCAMVRPPEASRRAPSGVSSGTKVREYWRGNVGAFVHRLPVNSEFSCAAGIDIWGFPKFVADIRSDFATRRASCQLSADGADILSMSMPARGALGSKRTGVDAFSYRDGVLRRVRWSLRAGGMGVHLPGSVKLELGTHPIADELRAAGLPRKPVVVASVRNVMGEFGDPEVVEI